MKLLFIFTFIFFSLIFSSAAFAHTLETDGQIGAILHTDPDDDPFVGENTNFYFEFKDRSGKFNPSACRCTFTILKGEEVVTSQELFATTTTATLTSPVLTAVFPEKGIYTVTVSGGPIVEDAFSDFSLSWNLRVEREKNVTSSKIPFLNDKHFVHYIGISFLVLVFLIFLVVDRKRQRNLQLSKQSKKE